MSYDVRLLFEGPSDNFLSVAACAFGNLRVFFGGILVVHDIIGVTGGGRGQSAPRDF